MATINAQFASGNGCQVSNKLLKEMNFFTRIVRVLWNMLGEQLHHQQSFFQNFIDVISLRVFQ
jgi:hypothetical protein